MRPDDTYASFLLRLRHMRSDTQAIWVASILSSATGEQHNFPSVEALVKFLLHEFGTVEAPDAAPSFNDDTAHH
ncbi:MAG: hypothetical protein HGA45_24030 [Chloroflexales bacterium]|nr:hypothetical protein [Chloroflexales bacterium]